MILKSQTPLYDPFGVDVPENFDIINQSSKQATTTKNTFAAMRYFPSYIMDRSDITLGMWLKLDKHIGTWMHSIREDVSKQMVAVKEQSAVAMPTIIQLMKSYKTSHHSRLGSVVLLAIKCQVELPDASNFDEI